MFSCYMFSLTSMSLLESKKSLLESNKKKSVGSQEVALGVGGGVFTLEG